MGHLGFVIPAERRESIPNPPAAELRALCVAL